MKEFVSHLATNGHHATRMEALRERHDDNLENLRDQALASLEKGDLERGRAVLEALISIGDQDAAIYLLLAGCCHQLDDLEAARRYFRMGVETSHAIGDLELCESALLWGRQFLEEAITFEASAT